MRAAYREHLNAFANDLISMCDMSEEVMRKAHHALVGASLQSAEDALSLDEDIDRLVEVCEARAVELLALEGPVARDLRQVVSSIYIVEDFRRMAALAMHIANAARRRHPDYACPELVRGHFSRMGELDLHMVAKIRDLLVDPDADSAVSLNEDDDAVDDIHEHIMVSLTQKEWPFSTREAVDVALIARYYERYADHAVNVSSRVIYLTTGLVREDYLAQRSR
ncbi:phosphate signaling complex protein PhoU [Corynebacterium atypicum]|uniref:phosphate signaling complex protein PhoU n=1 Tax=Corynebacterium atypicum TaxID=191610 RepID=UPI00056FD6BE|nr:phosphate signaling complex protein PhoU [Corynebacterium atypicum]